MKNLFLLFGLTTIFTSCTSDDTPTENALITPAKYKIEVVQEGNTENFNEIITLSTHLHNGIITNVKGIEWDNIPIQPTENLLQFYKTGGNPKNITLETSEIVEGVTISYMLSTQTNEELTTKIKFYKNGIFLKESTHKTNKDTFTLHSSSLN